MLSVPSRKLMPTRQYEKCVSAADVNFIALSIVRDCCQLPNSCDLCGSEVEGYKSNFTISLSARLCSRCIVNCLEYIAHNIQEPMVVPCI